MQLELRLSDGSERINSAVGFCKKNDSPIVDHTPTTQRDGSMTYPLAHCRRLGASRSMSTRMYATRTMLRAGVMFGVKLVTATVSIAVTVMVRVMLPGTLTLRTERQCPDVKNYK